MDPIIGSALIGAGSNLASGFFGSGGTEGLDRSEQRWLSDFGWKQSLRNEAFQREQFEWNKELSKHGLQMRMDDAEAAGISRLAALGMSPVGGASAMAFGGSPQGSPASRGSSPWGRALSDMGQSVSRAVMATSTINQRRLENARLREAEANADFAQVQAINATRSLMNPRTPPAPDRFRMTNDGELIPTHDYVGALMVDPLLQWQRSGENLLRRFWNSDFVQSGQWWKKRRN